MVQRVDRFEFEVQAHSFSLDEVLGDGRVPVLIAWHTHIAESEREGPERIWFLRGNTTWWRDLSRATCRTTGQCRVVELCAAWANLCGVRIVDCPALHICDVHIQLPASDEVIERTEEHYSRSFAAAERKLVEAEQVEFAWDVDLVGRLFHEWN